MNTKKHELLYKELSYQVQGAAFEVRKNFGPGLKESVYQNAFAEELKSRNLPFEKEKSIKIFSPKTGKFIGSYRPDFIIDGKVIVELKAVEKIPKMFIDQLYSYLRNSSYELGYFVNFASPKLYIKRIIFTNDRKLFLRNVSCLLVSFFVSFSVFLVFFSVFAPAARAAEISFHSKTQQLEAGRLFEVGVFINADDESINAIEGKISFPHDLLEIKKISDGNSIINFWIEKPKIESEGQIAFSGIIPGGYDGNQGLIASITFLAKKEGSGTIGFNGVKALRNDGAGTEAGLSISNLQFLVSGQVPIPETTTLKIKDIDPPESFEPTIAANPAIFEGKWFLVFATQDKKSGVDHYEVREGGRRFVTAESPYLLHNQNLDEEIVVKAVDKKGNERIAVIPAEHPRPWYKNYENWIIIIIGILVAIYITRIIRRKKYLAKKP